MQSKHMRQLIDRYRVTSGDGFRLSRIDPGDTGGSTLIDHAASAALLADGVQRLANLQSLLYPQNSWALLCLLQGMDASGKDGIIRHVMSGVNPQGVSVTSFKTPGPEELAHDFLWRVSRRLPERGQIGIFNRSHYEEVLVTRLHPEILARQGLPVRRQGKGLWRRRLEDIASFERYLDRQGTVVLKFFLHISRDEQKRRFLERMNTPSKTWKIAPSDIAERARWDEYMAAYEKAIAATATPEAPWYVVPANHKWAARLVVVEAMISALEGLDLHPPSLDPQNRAWIADARLQLEKED